MVLKKNVNSPNLIDDRFMEDESIYGDISQDIDMKRSIRPSDIWDSNSSLSYTQSIFPMSYSMDISDARTHKPGIFSTGISETNFNTPSHKPSNLASKKGHSWCELIPKASDHITLGDISETTKPPSNIPQRVYSIVNHLERFELRHLNDISSFFNVVKCPSCNRLLFSFLTYDSDGKHSCCHKRHKTELMPEKPVQQKKKGKLLQDHSSSSQPSKPTSTTRRKLARSPPILDLDRHCGVVSDPDSPPCMRSLTCKSHSVVAKRAVVGRSKSYDELLAKHKMERQADKLANSVDVHVPTNKTPSIDNRKLNTTRDPLMQLLRSSYITPVIRPPSFTAFGRSNFRHWVACGVNYSAINNRRTNNFSSMHIPFGSLNESDSLNRKTLKRKSPKKSDDLESKEPTLITQGNMAPYSMPDIVFT